MLRQTLGKKAHPSSQVLIEQCWPANVQSLPVTCRDAADVSEYGTLAFLHDAGLASHSVQSERSPTGGEDRPTSPPAHPRNSTHPTALHVLDEHDDGDQGFE